MMNLDDKRKEKRKIGREKKNEIFFSYCYYFWTTHNKNRITRIGIFSLVFSLKTYLTERDLRHQNEIGYTNKINCDHIKGHRVPTKNVFILFYYKVFERLN